MSVQDTARELRAIADRLANMRPILEVVAADIRTKTDDSFARAASPTGTPWRGLSDATIAINPRRAGGTPLSDTGRLRQSIATEVGTRELRFGTNVVYAAKQNFGDPNNRLFGRQPAPVPARQFLLVAADGRTLEPEEWWDEEIAMIEHWLATGEVR